MKAQTTLGLIPSSFYYIFGSISMEIDFKEEKGMGPYNRQQFETLVLVRRYLGRLSRDGISQLRRRTRSYLQFREDVAE